ncbi:MAG: murein biosynthesis integral membrane protein MurJ [Actinomycetales bacterium]|jgi:putative peptidoglycan lipid II flippase|nr:MAG: murein biosynthesis integral membrane protein MurJ [Actinomycetales bacterium]
MNDKSLLKSSTIMAVGTIVSRITGLARGLLLVAVLGTTLLGDTFNVANTMPNILYNLIIGGALTAIFVPQIVRSTNDLDGGSAFISRLVTATCVFLGGLVIISILLAPVLVRIFATSYIGRPEFDVTSEFMRYCLPQIFFMGLFALLGQVANAKGKFGPMMWAPVLNNLIAIGVFGWFLKYSTQPTVQTIPTSEIIWIGLGSTAGYVAQALILIPVISRTNIKIRPRFDWRDSELRKSLHLATWTLLFVAISQASYLVTVNLSTGAAVRALKAGIETGVGFTPFSNALLIYMLPHSIITISVVTALLPTLSKFAHEKKPQLIHDQLVKAMRIVGLVTVPSAVAFLFFGPLITETLFFGISLADSNYLGYTLSALALGLAPMSVNLIALRGLSAFENVKLQVLSNAIMNVIGILFAVALAFILPPEWVTVGLAGSLAISYYFGTWSTVRLLRRYEIHISISEVIGFYAKLTGLALVIALPTWLLKGSIPGGNTVRLLIVLFVSASGYLALCKIARVSEITSAIEVLTNRKKIG